MYVFKMLLWYLCYVMILLWQSYDNVMTISWHSHGPVMIMSWQCNFSLSRFLYFLYKASVGYWTLSRNTCLQGYWGNNSYFPITQARKDNSLLQLWHFVNFSLVFSQLASVTLTWKDCMHVAKYAEANCGVSGLSIWPSFSLIWLKKLSRMSWIIHLVIK